MITKNWICLLLLTCLQDKTVQASLESIIGGCFGCCIVGIPIYATCVDLSRREETISSIKTIYETYKTKPEQDINLSNIDHLRIIIQDSEKTLSTKHTYHSQKEREAIYQARLLNLVKNNKLLQRSSDFFKHALNLSDDEIVTLAQNDKYPQIILVQKLQQDSETINSYLKELDQESIPDSDIDSEMKNAYYHLQAVIQKIVSSQAYSKELYAKEVDNLITLHKTKRD